MVYYPTFALNPTCIFLPCNSITSKDKDMTCIKGENNTGTARLCHTGSLCRMFSGSCYYGKLISSQGREET